MYQYSTGMMPNVLNIDLLYQNATGVPNVTAVTNVPKMAKNDPSMPVLFGFLCICTRPFERTHC